MQNNGTTFEPEFNSANQQWEIRGKVKIFTVNYGKTSAHDATMHVKIIGWPLSEVINDDLCEKVAGPQIIHPGQNFGKIVGDKVASDQFFIYGFIDYIDAFESKWRYRFAFSHVPKRFFSSSKDDRWIAYSEHNDEQIRS